MSKQKLVKIVADVLLCFFLGSPGFLGVLPTFPAAAEQVKLHYAHMNNQVNPLYAYTDDVVSEKIMV